MKEMFSLAQEVQRSFVSPRCVLMQSEQIRYNELLDLAVTEMLSSITPENVVEETFSGSSLCAPFPVTSVTFLMIRQSTHSNRPRGGAHMQPRSPHEPRYPFPATGNT